MADLWTGPRSPEWVFTLLNSRDENQGALLGVRGGSVNILTLARLGGSAEIEITDTEQPIDFMNDRVRIEYDPGVPGLDPIPWGIWIFSSPVTSFNIVGRATISLLSKMVIIDEDTISNSFSLAQGTPIIPAVEALIQSTGETHIALTPSDSTTTNALVWESGESKLTIINDLLDSAGYQALWCDGGGQFRVGPYIEPKARPVSRVFEAGEASIHKPDWTREQDLAGVPNRVVVFCEGTDDEPAITGVAENWDPESIFSIPNRNGRIISRREEVTDISSQEEADSLASRYLTGGMSPVASLEIEHGIVPLDPGDRVGFLDGNPPTRRDATVQEMGMSFEPFAQCSARWREI